MKTVTLRTEGYSDVLSLKELLKREGMEEMVEIKEFGKKSKLVMGLSEYSEAFFRAYPEKHLFVLCDLYPLEFPHEYPHKDENELKQILMNQIQAPYHHKFHPHIAKWELEAWIFSDIEIVEDRLAITMGGYHTNPEAINDRTPPSRVLENFCKVQRKYYGKVENNPEIFKKLDINKIRSRCPCFVDFWDDLLTTIKDC